MNHETTKIIDDASTTIVQVAQEWSLMREAPDFFHRRAEIAKILKDFLKLYIKAIFNL